MNKKEIKINKKSAGRSYQSQTGITLIALVVIIVVLLILAGVSINALFRDSGTIKKGQEAQNTMDKAKENGEKGINELTNWTENQANETIGGGTTGEDDTQTTPKVSTLIGKVVTKNTKVEDAYGNKITIPKGFKILSHGTAAGSATYTYSGDNIPAVQDGIVIENETDGNQFVWVPVGTIKNKTGNPTIITLGRYSDFTAKNGVYTPTQSAEDYTKETIITASIKNKGYTIAKLGLENEKEKTIKINKAIKLEGIFDDVRVIRTAPDISKIAIDYKELTEFRSGNSAEDSTAQNATARNLKTFIETSMKNGGYYIARYEASGTTSKIASKYNQTVLTNINQPNAAKLAREMYGEVKENNELVYASDLINSYAWDTAIIFIQTYSTREDASSYARKNKSTSFEKTGIKNDKYCNICDMSGNACEWTTEYSAFSYDGYFSPCVCRGGYYDTVLGLADSGTSFRRDWYTAQSDSCFGLRSLLYVK